MSRLWGGLAICGMLLLPLRSAATTTATADQQITTLLNKLQHQVIEGHSTEPANDNAMTTWLQVVVLTSALTPGQAEAINDFVHTVRSEPGMSDKDIATLSMFANLADAIVKGSIDKMLPTPTIVTTVKAADPPPPSKPVAQVPAKPIAPRAVVTVAMAQPVPPPSKPTVPVSPPPHPVSPQTAAYVIRGDQMLVIGDISAARKFYEYAGAVVKLAETYDPEFLHRIGTIGLKPDITKAIALYREAAARGDAEAKARLAALGR